ncbi:DUF456 domain-containing protein [Cellulomonas rhizosphaerae]|uniref:DUF456 domain-containing protein n=1 Tax=Cellulomonas rhizosphaerae TaxID=2293719 RepID=A0A413RN48_9CELL|nr:DUF456 domain-containing protein [Cellulomonas rhizosphaerae]RHA43073.1 DUF456 domain-containing protein [Cellulomonas rhizosphaerae]
MSGAGELLVGLVILVGLFGVVVQVLPGAFLVLGAVLLWGVVVGGATGWTVVAVAVLATAAAAVVKYLLAGRHLARGGVPPSAVIWGGVAGVVGFFVIPVVGLFVGFLAGTYGAEWVRLREPRGAWRATVVALQATGITIVVELAGALVATAAWLVGVALA